MEELNRALDDVIFTIKESKEYQNCIQLKNKMQGNEDIVRLVDEVKKLQKEYVKSNYDSDIKKKLDYVIEELDSIPIYVIYNQELNKVNEMIDYVRDTLNEYFYKLLNERN